MRISNVRAGYTLLEMLVVMWGLAIALGMGIVLVTTLLRADRVSQATLRHLVLRATVADQFRADVGRAADAPDALGEDKRGPACLILRVPDVGHVIYRVKAEQLERIVRATDGMDVRRSEPIGPPESTVEFGRTEGERPTIVLRLIDAPAPGAIRRTEIAAVVGSDRR
ncbi:MAG: type II secretion system protein [Gemmataceae bacterium]